MNLDQKHTALEAIAHAQEHLRQAERSLSFLTSLIQAARPTVPRPALDDIFRPIIQAVAKARDLTPTDVLGSARGWSRVAEARVIAYFLCRKTLPTTIKVGEIAKAFDRSRSTVVKGIQSAQNRIDTDPAYRALVKEIEASIKPTSKQ